MLACELEWRSLTDSSRRAVALLAEGPDKATIVSAATITKPTAMMRIGIIGCVPRSQRDQALAFFVGSSDLKPPSLSRKDLPAGLAPAPMLATSRSVVVRCCSGE